MRNGPNEISASKSKFAVSLLKFNKLRGRAPDLVLSVVEGEDDPLFYSAMYTRLGLSNPDMFFVANGKDNVLLIRDHLSRSPEAPKSGFNTFFVDKDFDGTKGFGGGSDLYVTPTYSLENILVCRTALRSLLRSDFRLGSAECVGDVDVISEKFDGMVRSHQVELEEANRLLHWIRQKELSGAKIALRSIDASESKYVALRARDLALEKQATGEALASLLGLSIGVDEVDLSEYASSFSLLISKDEWRGKFLFYLFKRFISILVEDRNSDRSTFFSEGKGKVSLDTGTRGLIRILASTCEVPECLRSFANIRGREIEAWKAQLPTPA